MMVLEVLAAALILFGSAFAVLGAIGLHKFPDVFARMHAATKPITLGLACVLGGAAMLKADLSAAAVLLLAVALQFVTAPVAAHMVGRAAYRSGTELSSDTVVDELEGVELPPPQAGAG